MTGTSAAAAVPAAFGILAGMAGVAQAQTLNDSQWATKEPSIASNNTNGARPAPSVVQVAPPVAQVRIKRNFHFF